MGCPFDKIGERMEIVGLLVFIIVFIVVCFVAAAYFNFGEDE